MFGRAYAGRHEEAVRGPAERRRTARVAAADRGGHGAGAPADARADPAEGGRGPRGAGLGGRPGRRRGGDQPGHGVAGPQAVRRAGAGGGAGPPAAAAGVRAQAGRGGRGAAGRALLQRPAGRAGPLVAAAAGRQAGRAGGRRGGLVPDGRARARKNEIKPWLSKQWSIPPPADAEFVWRMEDVLDVYTRPDDPRFPLVCMDETSTQLLREVRPPVPPAPGRPERVDHEYERGG